MTALLQVNNLSRTFHRRGQTVQAVDNVSFSINAGETWALVGESGSGKSTTGRLILGLTPASGGEVHFEGSRCWGKVPRSGSGCVGRCR
jgi:ABC-type oligopeptide transport system ATPase subunit